MKKRLGKVNSKPYLLIFLLFFASLHAYSKVWIVSNSGFSFAPSTITITEGDTVLFDLASSHRVVEVNKTTWDANASTAIANGFETTFGGGQILPAKLTPGTHYFVCAPHASSGMKGTLIVEPESTVGIATSPDQIQNISISPNPSTGKFIIIQKATINEIRNIAVYNIHGKKIYQTNVTTQSTYIDLSAAEKGIYFIQIQSNDNAVVSKRLILNK